MRTTWIVRWRGVEEECSNLQDGMDRFDQLDACGIEVELFEVAAGQRRRLAGGEPASGGRGEGDDGTRGLPWRLAAAWSGAQIGLPA